MQQAMRRHFRDPDHCPYCGGAAVNVRPVEVDGHPLSLDEPLTVDITADGQLAQPYVRFEPGTVRATGQLRSRGWGPARIEAASGNVQAEPIEVEFVWPWLMLVLAAAGGLLGGGIRWSHSKEQIDVVRGVIAGLVFVAALATGIVVTHLPVDAVITEAGAFVVACGAGYAGRPIFERLAKMLHTGASRSANPGGA